MELNERQRQAARADARTALAVTAGPGTGKTRMLVGRIEHLVRSGLRPSSILAITFTRSAASEMRQRLQQADRRFGSVDVRTFHGLGLQLCRRYIGAAGLPADLSDDLGALDGLTGDFSIITHAEKLDILREALAAWDAKRGPAGGPALAGREYAAQLQRRAEEMREAVSRMKGLPGNPLLDPRWKEEPRFCYRHYLRSCASRNRLDLHDLIKVSCRLLEGSAAVRASVCDTYRHVLVDEFQDTSAAQLRLLKALVRDRGCVTAVGDADQSIFGFQGGDPENLSRFSETFPGAVRLRLADHYRCRPPIVAAFSALIGANPKERLLPVRSGGDRLRVLRCVEPWHEAARVASAIASSGRPPSDHAVLFRRNAVGDFLRAALTALRVPLAPPPGSEAEGMTLHSFCALLRLLAGAEALADVDAALFAVAARRLSPNMRRAIAADDRATPFEALRSAAAAAAPRPKRRRVARETPPRGGRADAIGVDAFAPAGAAAAFAPLDAADARAARALADAAARLRAKAPELSLKGLSERVVAALGGRRKSERLRAALAEDAARFERSLPRGAGADEALRRYAEHVAELAADGSWIEDLAAGGGGGGGVWLGSVHRAKGLEWPCVFVVRLNEGELPVKLSGRPADEAQERRLLYVAMSRAQEQLRLSYVDRSAEGFPAERSRFLRDVPGHLCDREDPPAEVEAAMAAAREAKQRHAAGTAAKPVHRGGGRGGGRGGVG